MWKLIDYFGYKVLKINFLLTILLGLLFISSCKKDNDIESGLTGNTGNTGILENAFFNNENNFEESFVTFRNENNEEISLFAFKSLVIVYFQDDVNLDAAMQIITQLNGKVIERIPAINYYLVKVKENEVAGFIKEMQKQKTDYVFPYFISEPYYYTAVIDDHRANKTHGKDVLWGSIMNVGLIQNKNLCQKLMQEKQAMEKII